MSQFKAETLLAALRQLERRGRIDHIWRNGMRVLDAEDRGGRILLANKRGIQLVEWELGHGRRTWHVDQIPNTWRIDIHDPATQGVLRYLVSEAKRDTELVAKGDDEHFENNQRQLSFLLVGFLLQAAEQVDDAG